MANCKIQESKKNARTSINFMFLGWMMMCRIKFVDQAVEHGKGVNELSFRWS